MDVLEFRKEAYDKQYPRSPLLDEKDPSPEELRARYELLLSQGSSCPESLESNLKKLKELILCYGIPDEPKEIDINKVATLRGRIWQILLGIKYLDIEEYKSLLADGVPQVKNQPPPDLKNNKNDQSSETSTHKPSEIIPLDANRTFITDREFQKKVPFDKLVRVLSAFHRKLERSERKYMGYIQGVNCAAGCFLYNMPEIEAFNALYILFDEKCPRYCGLQGGSYDGDALVKQILEVVDPALANRLQGIPLQPFTHTIIHSLATDAPPLTEVLKLWDVMLAFGVHMVTIFTVCMIVLRREEILVAPRPEFFLNYHQKPPIVAAPIISMAVQLIPMIPKRLYGLLALHPWKPLSVLEALRDPDWI